MINNTHLLQLRAIFVARGFDIWFVGGCVRDSLLGKEPKDIDLATSATPEEQIEIYTENNIRFIPTGLQHGTVSVVLDEVYEITSLRTETNHDGRWATVSYEPNEELLKVFVEMGFDPHADYPVEKLMEAFRRINR